VANFTTRGGKGLSVITTGVTTYIRDFVAMAFAEMGIELALKEKMKMKSQK
jgi:GDP-D-mannose dehydratase